MVGGQIQPGRALDLDAFRENLAGMKAASSTTAGFNYYQDLIADSSEYRVWWTGPQKRTLFIGGKPKPCWLPALVWCGSKHSRRLFVWGFCHHANVNKWGDQILYRPKLSHHVHGDGNVCLGNMNLPDFLPSTWEAGFYDTSFQDSIPAKPYEIKEQAKHGKLKDCLALASRFTAARQ